MDNVKRIQPANLDPYQMDNESYDAQKRAWRVDVVDGLTLNVDKINLPTNFGGQMETIKVPEIIKQPEIHQINVPVIVKEFQTIEVPIVVKEFEKVEIPVTVERVKIVEVEKPIVIKETEYKEMPLFLKICICMQALGTVGMLLTHILKG